MATSLDGLKMKLHTGLLEDQGDGWGKSVMQSSGSCRSTGTHGLAWTQHQLQVWGGLGSHLQIWEDPCQPPQCSTSCGGSSVFTETELGSDLESLWIVGNCPDAGIGLPKPQETATAGGESKQDPTTVIQSKRSHHCLSLRHYFRGKGPQNGALQCLGLRRTTGICHHFRCQKRKKRVRKREKIKEKERKL